MLDSIGCIDGNGSRPVPRIRAETILYGDGEDASDHYPMLATITFG